MARHPLPDRRAAIGHAAKAALADPAVAGAAEGRAAALAAGVAAGADA